MFRETRRAVNLGWVSNESENPHRDAQLDLVPAGAPGRVRAVATVVHVPSAAGRALSNPVCRYSQLRENETIRKNPQRIRPKSGKPVSSLKVVKNPVLRAQESCASKLKKKTQPYKKVLSWINKKAEGGVPGKDGDQETESLPKRKEAAKPVDVDG